MADAAVAALEVRCLPAKLYRQFRAFPRGAVRPAVTYTGAEAKGPPERTALGFVSLKVVRARVSAVAGLNKALARIR